MKKFIKILLITLLINQSFSNNKRLNNYTNLNFDKSIVSIDNPTVSINESLQIFTSCIGSYSNAQTFSVSGTDLIANITIQAPTGFEISNDNGLNWSSLITLNQNSGTVSNTNILIRIATSTTTITNSSLIQINSGSINETVSIDGYVINSASMDPGSISGNQIICSPGNPTTIISTNNGNSVLPNLPNTTISYQWQISTDNINWTTVTGVNTSSYNPPSGVNVTTYYRRILIVKVGNNFSCSSLPSNVVNATFINGFTVNAGPDIIVCKGETINLNAVSSGTTENVIYTWSGPSFTNSSQNTSISNAVFLMSGNYTVTAIISSGCNVTDTVNVLVIDEPNISSTMLNDQEFLVRCVTSPSATSGPIGFNLSIPSYSNNILNYSINWGSGSPLNETFDSSNWSNQITHVYGLGLSPFTITINTVNGCSISKVYNAFVGSSPAAATLVLNQNEANGCAPLTTTWTLTLPNNIVGTYYTCDWGEISNQDDFVLNHGGTIPNNTPTMTWSGPSLNTTTQVTTYTITKIYTNSSCGNNVITGGNTYYNAFQPGIITRNPCTVTPQPSGSGLVTIGRKPEANFTPSPFPTKICTGVPLQILNTSLFGQTIPSNNGATCTNTAQFYWTITRLTAPFTGGSTVTGNLGSNNLQPAEYFDLWTSGSMSPTITFNQTGIYRITLTIANSCGQDSIYKDICVQSRVTPAFSIDINQGCKPLIVSATNNSDTSVSCSNTTYLWNVSYLSNYCGTSSSFTFLNGTTNASANPIFQFNNSGTYNITLVTTNDCGSLTSAIQTVTVKQPPTVTINSIQNFCGTATINPTASVNICSPTGSPTTYLWTFTGANTIPAGADTAINPSGIVYSIPGTYTVSLVVTNECGSTTATKTFTVNALPTITGNLVICAQGTTQLTGSATAATTTPWTSSTPS
ncbi:MAG: PKD domain-containing protein, partial [Crocinitomicaceae bacterium]|nr:PKD domain-containing protein [Crocinitomicaceae bacterium]